MSDYDSPHDRGRSRSPVKQEKFAIKRRRRCITPTEFWSGRPIPQAPWERDMRASDIPEDYLEACALEDANLYDRLDDGFFEEIMRKQAHSSFQRPGTHMVMVHMFNI